MVPQIVILLIRPVLLLPRTLTRSATMSNPIVAKLTSNGESGTSNNTAPYPTIDIAMATLAITRDTA